MKQIFFINGDQASKEDYDKKSQNDDFESKLNYDKLLFEAKLFYDGKEINLEECLAPLSPIVYSSNDELILDIPNCYEHYSVNFIKNPKGNIVRVSTPIKDYDFPIKDFNHEPQKITKNNGIIIIK